MKRAWIVVLALAWTSPREADACTPPWQGVEGRTVLPEDGATGVPRNARILVDYDTGGDDPGGTLSLRVQGGADVAATVTHPLTLTFASLLTPTAALDPSTTYEVLDTLALPCEGEQPELCVGAPTVIATFTTGAALDTTPPTTTGLSVSTSYSCVADSCPESESDQTDYLALADVADDYPGAWVRFELLDPDDVVLAGPTSWTTLGRGCGGGDGFFPLSLYFHLPTATQIRPIDLAGNTGTARAFTQTGCELVDCTFEDAGVPEIDASPAADPSDDPAGCGCSTGADPRGGAMLVLVAILALRREHPSPRDAR